VTPVLLGETRRAGDMRGPHGSIWRAVAASGVILLIAACETAPTAPNVMVLPSAGASLEQFQADDTTCRQWATRQAPSPGQQRQYDIAYQQCMYAKGHVIPGAPAPRGTAAPPPPPR
jgi:hypothetical protein